MGLVDEEVEKEGKEKVRTMRKKRVVGEMSLVREMRVVRGKHLVGKPSWGIYGVCGLKLRCLIDKPLDHGGSQERNSSHVIFLI